MRLLTYILYGLVSGFAELIPVSGIAHQQLMQYVFGVRSDEAFLGLLIHIAAILGIVIGNFPLISRLRREQKRRGKRLSQKRNPDSRNAFDLRIVRTAAVPMLIGMAIYAYLFQHSFSLMGLTVTFLISGTIGLAADHMRLGNKDSRHISALDAILIGICSSFSAIPGISRVGMSLSVATARGADRNHAYNWSVLLSIPALVFMAVMDVIVIANTGTGIAGFTYILLCIASAAAAFAGSFSAITFMNYLAVRTGFSGIAYYNLGVAVFSFILFLIT